MKLREGRIITMYDDFEDNPRTHFFIIVDNETGDVIVDDSDIPNDFEKNFNSTRILVEECDNGEFKFHKKTFNIRELLLTFGPSKEMKQRLSNGQIKINNEIIKSYDVECEFETSSHEDLPEFLIDNTDVKLLFKRKKFLGLEIMNFFGSPTLKEGPTNIEQYKFLKDYVLLSISKNEHFVFKNTQIDKQPYSLTKSKQCITSINS